MPTPVLADLVAGVATRCGLLLAEAGVYLDGPAGSSPAILEGIRRGFKAVGVTLNDPLVPADADVLNLSSFAIERVEDEAERFALHRAAMNWWRVARMDQDPVSATPIASGWRLEQKRAVKERLAELASICDQPYREPTAQVVVTDPSCPPGMACPSIPTGQSPWYPPDATYPYGSPYGHGGWSW
jgi:hypothetical protein